MNCSNERGFEKMGRKKVNRDFDEAKKPKRKNTRRGKQDRIIDDTFKDDSIRAKRY